MNNNKKQIYWRFGIKWIFFNLFGWGTFYLLTAAAGWLLWQIYENYYGLEEFTFITNESNRSIIAIIISTIGCGIIVGALQQRILRQYFGIGGNLWFWSTAFGITIYKSFYLINIIIDYIFYSSNIIPSYYYQLYYNITLFGPPILLGISQWFACRKYFKWSVFWIFATAIGLWFSQIVHILIIRENNAWPILFFGILLVESLFYSIATYIIIVLLSWLSKNKMEHKSNN